MKKTICSISILALFALNNSLYAADDAVKGTVIVGGVPREVQYEVKRTNAALFPREDYLQKTGRIIEVNGPNRVLVETGGRTEEFQLIGLMDISPVFNPDLRKNLTEEIAKRYKRKNAKIYIPKAYQELGLEFNHAFLISEQALINSEILENGLGVIADAQNFYYPLKEFFTAKMHEAAEKKIGLWK
jgi:hypothetical protein